MNKSKGFFSKVKSLGSKGIIGAGIVVVLLSSYGYNEGGVNTRLQIPLIGATWIKEEGYYLKAPLISRVVTLNKNGTVASTDNKDLLESSSIVVPPTTALFADSFQMAFEWSVRYELPVDDEGLELVYQKQKSQAALLANTVMPFAQTLFTDSVNQMLGESFAQGGKNSLRTLIDNQSQFGMFQTKVETVKVARGSGKGTNDTIGGANTDMEITKVIYLTDPLTNKRLRTPLSIAQYGIKIVPNSFQIIENKPVGRLITFIDKKQASLELQIAEDEAQVLIAKQTQTEQLNGEKVLIARTNVLNVEKQEAVISAEKRNEEARLQAEKEVIEANKIAELAIIDKNRELQMAQADEGIQKAFALAAKYEASAIKEVGFAKAAVKDADYKAIDKTILALEVDKAKALALYSSNMTVNMPMIVGGKGDTGGDSSLEIMTSLKVMEQLGKAVKQ